VCHVRASAILGTRQTPLHVALFREPPRLDRHFPYRPSFYPVICTAGQVVFVAFPFWSQLIVLETLLQRAAFPSLAAASSHAGRSEHSCRTGYRKTSGLQLTFLDSTVVKASAGSIARVQTQTSRPREAMSSPALRQLIREIQTTD
jgi:hypothetical protein